MNEVTLVHLVSEETPPDLAEALALVGITEVVQIHMDTDPARTCQRISQSTSAKNLVIIATGNGCNQLPAIALAQRSSGKNILSYQLLQPVLPAFTDSWPQAPVTAYFPVGSTIPKEITLRGIRIEAFEGMPEFAALIENCVG